jgi:N-acetylmuramoyl-L-alanine amidase
MAGTFIDAAQYLPVIYATVQMPMQMPVLGAVLHTTNSPGGLTLQSLQSSWQAGQNQTAHFAVDRDGNIGQYRGLEEVAWHIGKLSPRYIGIEHIANWQQPLTDDQINASAALLAHLAAVLSIPLAAINNPLDTGIGYHQQFNATACGDQVFCANNGTKSLYTFDLIINKAQDLTMGPQS